MFKNYTKAMLIAHIASHSTERETSLGSTFETPFGNKTLEGFGQFLIHISRLDRGALIQIAESTS